MSTSDVPGANPKNADKLATGCWAEHSDGSLLFVKGTENGQIVYELYDVVQTPPVYYQDAMREEAFKKAFSAPPVGASKEDWTWHDKTPFPWARVMKTFDKPVPVAADAPSRRLASGASTPDGTTIQCAPIRTRTVATCRISGCGTAS